MWSKGSFFLVLILILIILLLILLIVVTVTIICSVDNRWWSLKRPGPGIWLLDRERRPRHCPPQKSDKRSQVTYRQDGPCHFIFSPEQSIHQNLHHHYHHDQDNPRKYDFPSEQSNLASISLCTEQSILPAISRQVKTRWKQADRDHYDQRSSPKLWSRSWSSPSWSSWRSPHRRLLDWQRNLGSRGFSQVGAPPLPSRSKKMPWHLSSSFPFDHHQTLKNIFD